MKKNVAQKLIESHLVSGSMKAGDEIGLKIDHILQQDATGTLIMLELEKIGIEKISAEVAVQYVDHNLLQTDFKNADDHAFLQSAAQRFGYWYSRPGNGISHVVHMENFGMPGKSMVGSDSHTCSAGSLGMLAIGAGGLDVATAATGEPYFIKMPRILGIELTGELCSPETAAVSALNGQITNPQDFAQTMKYPEFKEPEEASVNKMMLIPPMKDGADVQLKKGPNIKSLPDFGKVENSFNVPVILKLGDNISTDEILKAGAEVLPLRSNIEAISKYTYYVVSGNFYDNARKALDEYGGHIVVAGENYAQGSSREHAAIAPRYLGQKAVIAKSYARIGFQNLVNYGIVPFVFQHEEDYDEIKQGQILEIKSVLQAIQNDTPTLAVNQSTHKKIAVECQLTNQQKNVLLAGGLINYLKQKK